MTNKELKHWGILGQKWGLRRYQNEDGSLTPEGRNRYGVGQPRLNKSDGGSLSDEELRIMTKRYRDQANYYNARNEYIKAEQYYKQLTNPKRDNKVGKFMETIFLQPLTKILQKNVEFGLTALGANFVNESDSKYAEDYLNFMFNKNKNKDKDKNDKYKNDGN